MRHIPLWAGAIPLFAAASAHAQFITPVEGTRSVSANISATDNGTNIVDSDTRRTDGFEDFSECLELKASTSPQYDDTHSHVDANGSGTETSKITGSRITASVSATAEGVSQTSSARGYATGNADFYLTFQVNRFARYTVAGDANAASVGNSYGGSAALVHIASLTTGVPVLSIDIGNTDSDSVRRRGWVNAGPYTLQGDVSALVDAKNNLSGTASASWTMDFQLFCPSDYDVNGTVNTADRDAFLSAWNAGSLDADADGNGTVNATDRTTFLLAYGAGC
ncbi:GC-type dockerin domain-anchored protein [Pyxidicoccus trucidator]|uniref:GC-type dockerin domain-anchored protein n=1 Tax=Pyxidicoccus trucidator TaxID=2709662 RepID=UPI0013DBB7D6|nr:GC-type dockerin domain-anchored protein [Pyxidicoccus trucidator]